MSQQRQQSRGRGSAPRQAPAPRQEDRPATENEQISRDQSAQKRMALLFELIRQRRAEVEAVLPSDVPYLKFEAVVNMAIRREPRLLECYVPSFIKACIQAAYDGLLPDGNQAVILYSSNKVPGTGENGTKTLYRLEARYQSMVYGLRLKLVQAGAVKFIDAKIVHKNDHFDFEEGVNRRLEHKPVALDKEPGEPIGAYAVAILPDGTKVFDVLRKQAIMAARDVAKTKNVWDGPFGLEMWKKTAIRRLTKAIPTAQPIRDAEALEMFPQFGGAVPGTVALPAPPRPHRSDFKPALEHREELPLDLGAFEGGYETEESRRATKAAEESGASGTSEGPRARKGGEVMSSETSSRESDGSANAETAGGAGPKAKGGGEASASSSPDPQDAGDRQAENGAKSGSEAAENSENRAGDRAADEPPLPEGDEAWDSWADILISGLEKLPDEKAVNEEHENQRRLIDAAPENVRRRVVNAMQERITDIVAPPEGQGTLGIGEGE
jgi:recombination protein RecT